MLRRRGWRVCRACQRERLLRLRRAKGMQERGVLARGDQNGAAKLTADQVRQIRAADATLQALSAEFGVAPSTISLIRNRKRWSHLA